MADPLSPPLPNLTPQEGKVLALLLEGVITKEIAAELGLSPRTVSGHEAMLREKFGARNRVELVARVLKGNYRSDS